MQSHVVLLYKKITEVMGDMAPSNRFKLRNGNVFLGTFSSTGYFLIHQFKKKNYLIQFGWSTDNLTIFDGLSIEIANRWH